jgi:hypothetical protein
MTTSHIRTTHQYGEVFPNVFSDFDWVKAHEAELLTQYGTCTILVYQRAVIGYGETEDAALQMAESNIPDDFAGEITPITYYLAKRQPFYRVMPVQQTDTDS